MQIIDTSIPDVKIIEPQVFGDECRFFMEIYCYSWFKEHITDVSFAQDNHSKSSYGILHVMHNQIQQPQGKLVRISPSEMFDIAINLHKSNPTFGQWDGVLLFAENKRQLWVPAGFAHDFYVMSRTAEFIYKCTDYYAPEYGKSLLWNDPDLTIDRPISIGEMQQLSAKDAEAISFQESEYLS